MAKKKADKKENHSFYVGQKVIFVSPYDQDVFTGRIKKINKHSDDPDNPGECLFWFDRLPESASAWVSLESISPFNKPEKYFLDKNYEVTDYHGYLTLREFLVALEKYLTSFPEDYLDKKNHPEEIFENINGAVKCLCMGLHASIDPEDVDVEFYRSL